MDKISLKELQEKCNEFKALEKRGSFYDMALNLLRNGYNIEASILILATWNFANFRYVLKEFDMNNFKEVIEEKCKPVFEGLKERNLESVIFDDISEDVKQLYNILSRIKGIEYTGASKLMHLNNPKLFVMWDSYIKKYYHFGNTAEDYIRFLRKMQEMFGEIGWKDENKTLAKAIDEYNYVTITLPEIKKQKEKKKQNL